jgi:hypothetical protein
MTAITLTLYACSGDKTHINARSLMDIRNALNGAWLEAVRLPTGILFVDEEGALKQLPLNPFVKGDPIYGNMVHVPLELVEAVDALPYE